MTKTKSAHVVKPNARLGKNGRLGSTERLITCKEVRRKYDGHWVVMEIRKWTKSMTPYAGIVVKASKDKNVIYRAGGVHRDKNPQSHLYYFYAGAPPAFKKGVPIALAFSN